MFGVELFRFRSHVESEEGFLWVGSVEEPSAVGFVCCGHLTLDLAARKALDAPLFTKKRPELNDCLRQECQGQESLPVQRWGKRVPRTVKDKMEEPRRKTGSTRACLWLFSRSVFAG
jgi:hypothetical protein